MSRFDNGTRDNPRANQETAAAVRSPNEAGTTPTHHTRVHPKSPLQLRSLIGASGVCPGPGAQICPRAQTLRRSAGQFVDCHCQPDHLRGISYRSPIDGSSTFRVMVRTRSKTILTRHSGCDPPSSGPCSSQFAGFQAVRVSPLTHWLNRLPSQPDLRQSAGGVPPDQK